MIFVVPGLPIINPEHIAVPDENDNDNEISLVFAQSGIIAIVPVFEANVCNGTAVNKSKKTNRPQTPFCIIFK